MKSVAKHLTLALSAFFTKICEVADICCDGRVVSVLEGGYGKTPSAVPPPPLVDNGSATESDAGVAPQGLDRSLIGDCAMEHLRGLIDPYSPSDNE